MVPAARAVGVEVLALETALLEIAAGGRLLLDRARGRDVVGCDAVAEQGEAARARDLLEAFGRRLMAGSSDAVSADDILARLPALEHDRPRARVILKQLVSEGLLEERTPAAETTAGTYALTRLGRARIEQRRRPDDD